MINQRHATAVLAVLREGSVTAAARSLYVSQPALSQTIKAVEAELGLPLFQRESGRLVPTRAGLLYTEAVQKTFSVERELLAGIEAERGTAGGTFALGIAPQRAIRLLPELLPAFSKKYPDVRIRLVEENSTMLETLVREGQCDIALITAGEERHNLRYIPVERESYVLAAAKTTGFARRFAEGTPPDIGAAKDERFVSLAEGHCVREVQDSLFQKSGIRPRILLETRSLELAKRVTAAADALCVLPDVYAAGDPVFCEKVRLYPLDGRRGRRFCYFCLRKDLVLTEYERDMMRMTCAALGRPFAEPAESGKTPEDPPENGPAE